MKKDRIYVGSGKEMFDGDLVNISINLSKISECKEQIFEYNGEKFIKLKVAKKREMDDYGKSHFVEVDTWKPEAQESKPVFVQEAEDKRGSANSPVGYDDGIPF